MFTRGDTIGLIGTGLMGTAMAERLLAAGFRVLGWDCDAARLAASGAEAAGSSAAVADACRGVRAEPAGLAGWWRAFCRK